MRRVLTILQQFPWHSFMVAMLPFLHFHQKNFRTLGPWDGWGLLLVYWAVVLALLALGNLVWKSWSRAGLVVTPLVAVLAKGWALGPWVSILLLAVSLVTGILLFRHGKTLEKMNRALTLAVFVLVVFPLVEVVKNRRVENEPRPSSFFLKDAAIPGPGRDVIPPDVYFLMVDGLGQPRYLEESFGMPRHLLTGGLQRKGFQILDQARANYPQTALSTAATLNMATIPHLLDIQEPTSGDRRPLAGIIRDSRVGRAFADLGYQTVTYPSGYPLTRLDGVDHRHEPVLNPSFTAFYVLSDGFLPLVQPLLGKGPADLSFALRRGRLNYIFDNLGRARSGVPVDQPVFVFAHILAPHPPFVFDPEGNPQPSRARFTYGDGNDWHRVHPPGGIPYHRLWTSQAIHVMKRINEAVDQILASAPRPPIIIIQGDHGPGSQTHWDSVGGTNHVERFGIFNAWYLPEDLPISLPQDQTSINTFPLLFNAVFGARLPIQENRHWFARMKEPYNLFEVKE